MSKSDTTRLGRYIRDLADVQTPDRDLLRRFLDLQDEVAFETLVRRHDRLVRCAIAKALGNAADAEDAYQATFVVLARRARSIDWRVGLGPWLYGVAHRVAVKAQARRAKRTYREGFATPKRSILPPDLSWQEACDLLHAELDGLPDTYRMPLLLCYLEGKTREEAAALLGVSSGAVRGRVRRGLDVLRQRLSRRGVALSVGLLAVLAAPPRIMAAATSPTAIVSVIQNGAPSSVTTLVQEVIMRSALSKLSKVLALVVVLIGLTAGLLAAARESQTQPPQAEAKVAGENKSQRAPQRPGPGTLLLARERDLVSLSPEGKTGNELSAPQETRTMHHGRLSPDGTRAAFTVSGGKPRGPGDDLDAPWPIQLVIRKLGAIESKAVDFPGHGVDVVWSPNGKRLAVTKQSTPQSSETLLLDPESGKTEPLDLPAGVRILDWARDGTTFLVVYRHDEQFRLGLVEKSEKEVRELTSLKIRFSELTVARFSPDSKKVLFTDADPEQKDAHKWHRSSQPHILEIATKKRRALAEFPDNAQCLSVAWSPDGNRVAYTWCQLHPEVLKKETLSVNDVAVQTESFLIIADADGKNAKTVASDRSDQAMNAIYGSIDWR
jgi:RNA polymerase sigma factor (sigma-70 family)